MKDVTAGFVFNVFNGFHAVIFLDGDVSEYPLNHTTVRLVEREVRRKLSKKTTQRQRGGVKIERAVKDRPDMLNTTQLTILFKKCFL
jgi:hypothetical protein